MCDWKGERDRIKKRITEVLPKNFKGEMVYKVPIEKIDKKHLEQIKQILDEEGIDLNVDKIARSNTRIKTGVIHMEFKYDLMSGIDNVFKIRCKRGFCKECPHCGAVFYLDQKIEWINESKRIAKCSECGEEIKLAGS